MGGNAMVTEILKMDVRPEMIEPFKAAMKRSRALLEKANGCLSIAVKASIEHPNRYYLMVDWESREHHIEQLPKMEGFQESAEGLARCLVEMPAPEHIETVAI